MTGDARLGQRWSRAQRWKNDAIYLGLRGLDAGFARAPSGLVSFALRAAARATLHHSTVANDNVRRVFPDRTAAERRRLLDASAEALAQHAALALRAVWQQAPLPALPFAPGSLEIVHEALAARRGVVLASAHLGAWDRVAHTLATHCDFAAVTREPYDRRLGRWLAPLRAGFRSIPRGPQAARPMLSHLRSGGVLGIPMDLATRGVEACTVPFLGVPTAIVSGPARLAVRTGAAVVVATYTHVRGAEALRAVRVEPPNDADSAQAVHVLTERLAASLSEAILLCPEQWLWMHPRWTTPAPGPVYSGHGAAAHR